MSERSSDGRARSLKGRLARLGFADPARAAASVPALGDEQDPTLLEDLARTADPDQALTALVRLCDVARAADEGALLRTVLDGPGRPRLLAVLGASTALADFLCRAPAALASLLEEDALDVPSDDVRARLLEAVGADPAAEQPSATRAGQQGVTAMRVAYRTRVLEIAARDLTSRDPSAALPRVGAALADVAAAALEAGLALARADHPGPTRLAVIGMGKCGGRELNYVSDVDVVYVVEPGPGQSDDDAVAAGTRLAADLARACAGPAPEPALWTVDTALRPEGRNGPLVRTLASHAAYYERWAQTWEFQALLKARPVAGDPLLGRAYRERIDHFVWSAVERDNFVTDAQAMRRRVEEHVPAAQADRQIKLGVGGLRDVEFTVQLLQLVHGRADPELRSPTTLDALAALSAAGYVGRDHAERLAECYRLLRVLEHRIQLVGMRRTHLMPTAEPALRHLARAAGLGPLGAAGLEDLWRRTRRDVRSLHEDLFYRPLLPATARLSTDEARLAPAAAQERLAAIGYRDPAGALRHITALTEGISRRAAIQRQLLPVMIGWFAEGADADDGLLAFRRLSDVLGSTHWYLKLLRDSRVAAGRLAHVLSTSRYVAEALTRSPEAVAWLADDADLAPRAADRLVGEVDAVLAREAPGDAWVALRALRRRELSRIAAADVLHMVDGRTAAQAVTDVSDAVLAGALRAAEDQVRAARGTTELPTRVLVVAMGRLGGREMGYASDADVLFVHDPEPGADPGQAQEVALAVAGRLRTGLSSPGPEPAFEVDADLRPEGRSGPLVRSLASYAEYYGRWSDPWEAQALLRARAVAGDPELGDRFMALIEPLRYPAGGLDEPVLREIRRIKARVESERLPRGVEPGRHVKLGRGGLADVEWTVQLLQMCHGHARPGLRTTQTLEALVDARDAGLVSAAQETVLREAWVLASLLRDAVVLRTGRTVGTGRDVLPHDHHDLDGLARLLSRPSGAELEQEYLRAARRARTAVEDVFYG